MTLIQIIILALVQAVTEFIPVSSSGHLLAIEELSSIDSSLAFDVILHFGTLLALVVYFWPTLVQIVKDVLGNNDYKLAINLVITSAPAAAAGFIFSNFLSDDARQLQIVIAMLAVVGIIMIFSDKLFTQAVTTIKKLQPKQALIIGLGQALALIPGTSRSGATILTARQQGMSNEQAAEYAFLAGIPVIAGATLKILTESDSQSFIADQPLNVFIGVIVTALAGLLVLRWMLRYLKRHGLVIFGWYRLVLAGLLFVLLINQ